MDTSLYEFITPISLNKIEILTVKHTHQLNAPYWDRVHRVDFPAFCARETTLSLPGIFSVHQSPSERGLLL